MQISAFAVKKTSHFAAKGLVIIYVGGGGGGFFSFSVNEKIVTHPINPIS